MDKEQVKYPFEVESFYYNGIFVMPLPEEEGFCKMETYKARFLRWTDDPGIAKCECSDGKVRNIPSCQLKGEGVEDLKWKPYKEAD